MFVYSYLFSWFYWDPNPEFIFLLPNQTLPIYWYSLLFAIGLLLGFFLVQKTLHKDFMLNPAHLKICHRLIFQLQQAIGSTSSLSSELFLNLSSISQVEVKNWSIEKSISSTLQKEMNQLLNKKLNAALADRDSLKEEQKIWKELQEEWIEDKRNRTQYFDKLLWYSTICILIGARLGHVLFYERAHFFAHPIEILKTWEGGLASHGGVIGIIFAVILFFWRTKEKYAYISFYRLLDAISFAAPVVAVCIRVGNFFNQEILGTPSQVPWAIIFGNPRDRSASSPCHPVQLYEALGYAFIFMKLCWLQKSFNLQKRLGLTTGLVLIEIFSFRFLIEFYKLNQEENISSSAYLQMGQWLSLPCIFLGILFILKSKQTNHENPSI